MMGVFGDSAYDHTDGREPEVTRTETVPVAKVRKTDDIIEVTVGLSTTQLNDEQAVELAMAILRKVKP